MRFADRRLLPVVLFCLLGGAAVPAETLVRHEQQRYSMGTMFGVIVYHASAATAERAAGRALAEIARLDRVMSHYKEDSDLSRLNREGHRGVVVEPSLYEIVAQSLEFSRRSAGRFDVTIGPLLRTWKEAHASGRTPSSDEIGRAARCVGHENVELIPPDRIRLRSDCVELDLGGIGKGYAVERALATLRLRGIAHALVNAGGSTIASIGAPPGERGWPIQLGASVSGGDTLLLRDTSISTSQQSVTTVPFSGGTFGDIIDPGRQAPSASRMAVSVIAPSATASDALSTALLLMPIEDGRALLEQFARSSALWISPAGELQAAYRASELHLAHVR